jgi:cyanophycin synthetase
VLDADAPDVAALAEHCDGEVIWTSAQPAPADVPDQQRSVRCLDGRICLMRGTAVLADAPLPELSVLVAPEVVCAAAAAAWVAGLAPALVAAGLDNFGALPGA